MRRNMALVTLMMAPAAPAASLFGAISDRVGRLYGPAVGFRTSFAACAGVMVLGILVALSLPARPEPAQEEGREPSPTRTSNDDLVPLRRASSTAIPSRTCGPSTPGIPRSSASTTASWSRRSTSARGSRASTIGRTSPAPATTAGPGGLRSACSTRRPPGDRPTRSGSAGRPTGRSSASAAGTTATTPRRGWSTGATSATSRWT